MGWAALAKALLSFATLIASIFRDRQLRQEGVQTQVVQDQKESLDAIRNAADARSAVEHDLASGHSRLRDPDEFERKA